MSDEEKRIRIIIEGQDNGASDTLKGVGSGLSGILEVAGGILTSQVLTGVFDQIVGAVSSMFGAASEEQDIMTLLNQGVDHLGSSAAMTTPEMVGLAESIGKTTEFSHDLVLQGENILMRFTAIGHDTFPQVIQAASDMAAVTGQDLPNMLRILGRTLEDPAAGMATLRRYNIVLTDAQKDSIKSFEAQGETMKAQGVILDAIEKSYGGAAAAMGGTFTGQQAIFKNNMESISETLGTAFLPLMTSFNTILSSIAANPQIVAFFDNLGASTGKLLDPLTHLVSEFTMIFDSGNDAGTQVKMIEDALTGLSPILGEVVTDAVNFGTSISGAFSSGGLSGVISMLTGGSLDTGIANLKSFFGGDWSGPLAATQATLAKFEQTIVVVFQAISTFVTTKVLPFLVDEFNKLSAWLNDNKPLIERFLVVLNQLFQGLLIGIQWLVPQLLGLWTVISPLLDGLLNLILNLVKMVMQAFTGDWAGIWETFKQTIAGAATSIWTALVNLLNWIAGLFGSSLAQIGATWSGVWDAMKLTVSLIWGIISAYFQGIWQGIVTIWDGITAYFAGVWKGFVNTVTTIGLVILGIIFTIMDGILALFGTSLLALKANWEIAWKNIATAATNAWTGISTFFAGAWVTFSTFWAGVWTKIVQFVTDKIVPLAEEGGKAVTSLWDSIKTIWTNVSSWWGGVLNDFVTVLAGIGAKLYTVGQDIITGLWNGLKNIWADVQKWWEDTVQSFIDKAKSILDGHSPSQEFFKIGESIVDGLVGGIGKNIQVPVNMIGNLGTNMIGAMSGAGGSTSTANSVTININGAQSPKAVVDEIMQRFQLQGIKFNLAGA